MVPMLLSIVTSVQAGAIQALYSENAGGKKKIKTQFIYLLDVIWFWRFAFSNTWHFFFSIFDQMHNFSCFGTMSVECW